MRISIQTDNNEIDETFKHILCDVVPRVGEVVTLKDIDFIVKTVFYEYDESIMRHVPSITLREEWLMIVGYPLSPQQSSQTHLKHKYPTPII